MTRVASRIRIAGHGLAAVLIGATLLTPASAQPPGSRQTRDFVEAMAQADAFEILEAQAALAQSTDPAVRAFAAKMIVDHGALDRTLAEAAAKAGLRPPAKGVGADQAALLNGLQSPTGVAFDHAYLQHQRQAHAAALTEAQAYAASGDQPAIRTLAATAAQTIAAHRAMVEQMTGQAPRP